MHGVLGYVWWWPGFCDRSVSVVAGEREKGALDLTFVLVTLRFVDCHARPDRYAALLTKGIGGGDANITGAELDSRIL